MPFVTPNSVGLDVVSYARLSGQITRDRAQECQVELNSGGQADPIYKNTKDVQASLSILNAWDENKSTQLALTGIQSKLTEKISNLQVFQDIATQLGNRLSGIRTNSPLTDTDFIPWCQTQLTDIARRLNRPSEDGDFPFAAQSKVPPVDIAKLTTLNSGATQDLTYFVGKLGDVDHIVTQASKVNAAHPGIEGLIRSLRMALSGNVNNTQDQTWTSCLDLTNNTTLPQLSSALQETSELSKSCQTRTEALKSERLTLTKQYQDVGVRSFLEVFEEKERLNSLSSIQRSTYIKDFMETDHFLKQLEQASL